MSTLTKEERDGLEEVFLSIHSHNKKLEKLKQISQIIIYKKIDFSFKYLLKGSKYGVKKTNFSHLFTFFTKKKKHLRK
jgi:hypothetical protein